MRLFPTFGLVLACVAALVAAEEPPAPGPIPSPTAGARGCRGDFDEPPRLVRQSKPVYPPPAIAKHVQGVVVVEVLVDVEGMPSDVKVVKSVPELDEAALACVRTWKFAPATKDGRAVTATCKVPMSFKVD